jgi:hypothetical protein
LRTVWAINPGQFSDWAYDFKNADYVDDCGIPRTRSQDCPIHGLHAQPLPTDHEDVSDDGQANHQVSHIVDIDDHHAQEQAGVALSTVHHRTALSEDSQDVLSQESTDESKIDDCPDEVEREKSLRSPHTQLQHEVSKTDLLGLPCAHSATESNNQNHKNAHAPLSEQPDSVSLEMPCHIESTLSQLFSLEPFRRIDENSTLGDVREHEQDTTPLQKADHNNHKHPQSSSDTSANDYKCTCKISQVSHFAVFPPALVEPCIKAGTSERGVCPSCGTPWERVTEKESQSEYRPMTTGQAKKEALGDMARTTPQGRTCGTVETKTLAWRPTCHCPPADPVPATVLDPFAGAGTTLLVADRLGRDGIGIELNSDYVEMSERRIAGDSPMFAQVVTIGD